MAVFCCTLPTTTAIHYRMGLPHILYVHRLRVAVVCTLTYTSSCLGSCSVARGRGEEMRWKENGRKREREVSVKAGKKVKVETQVGTRAAEGGL